jgi:hypothetical protein
MREVGKVFFGRDARAPLSCRRSGRFLTEKETGWGACPLYPPWEGLGQSYEISEAQIRVATFCVYFLTTFRRTQKTLSFSLHSEIFPRSELHSHLLSDLMHQIRVKKVTKLS